MESQLDHKVQIISNILTMLYIAISKEWDFLKIYGIQNQIQNLKTIYNNGEWMDSLQSHGVNISKQLLDVWYPIV